MTSIQKVIKYLAIAFALFLIVTIISATLGGFIAISAVLGLKSNYEIKSSQMRSMTFQDTYINILEIDVNYTNLTIKKSNSLSIETNNNRINCKQNNNKLEIKENKHNWVFNNENLDLIVYIPENLKFEKVEINSGAGRINIENLDTEKLDFELGAGETSIQSINASKECKIDGGAGKIDIFSGTINNLDLDMGIGEANLYSILTGKNDIDAGVGNLNIDLETDKENYTIRVNKGIGTVKVAGKSLSDGEIYGSGTNYIDVDGGIGNIRINFKSK